MSEALVEEDIQRRYYNLLKDQYHDDALVMNWDGFWEKIGQINKKQDSLHFGPRKSPFYSEFDIARFHRVLLNGKYRLELYGYEIKGVTRDQLKKERWRYPRVTSGLDQALTLHFQEADYSYLVTPRPEKEDHEKFLLDFRKKFTPKVGIIFAEIKGSFTEMISASRFRTNRTKKEDNLIRLIVNGAYKKNSLYAHEWCRDRTKFQLPPLTI